MSAPKRHPVYVVRQDHGQVCGHQHRDVVKAVHCMQRLIVQLGKYGPTNSHVGVYRIGSGERERLVIGGNATLEAAALLDPELASIES